jgi:hypothetical protein
MLFREGLLLKNTLTIIIVMTIFLSNVVDVSGEPKYLTEKEATEAIEELEKSYLLLTQGFLQYADGNLQDDWAVFTEKWHADLFDIKQKYNIEAKSGDRSEEAKFISTLSYAITRLISIENELTKAVDGENASIEKYKEDFFGFLETATELKRDIYLNKVNTVEKKQKNKESKDDSQPNSWLGFILFVIILSIIVSLFEKTPKYVAFPISAVLVFWFFKEYLFDWLKEATLLWWIISFFVGLFILSWIWQLISDYMDKRYLRIAAKEQEHKKDV